MKNVLKYIKFLIGGALSLLLNISITLVITEIFDLHYMMSFAIALAIEILFLFLYHSVITFNKKGKFVLFILIILFISDLNWIIVYYLTNTWKFHYIFAIVFAASGISLLNFVMNKTLVFEK